MSQLRKDISVEVSDRPEHKIYEWPISFECVDCGDNLTYKFGKNGLFPKEFTHIPSPQDPSITTIGYSSSLPITDELYMKGLDYEQSMAFFSPFMNLSFKSPFFHSKRFVSMMCS